MTSVGHHILKTLAERHTVIMIWRERTLTSLQHVNYAWRLPRQFIATRDLRHVYVLNLME